MNEAAGNRIGTSKLGAFVALATLSALVAGCVLTRDGAKLRQRLDESSGETITTLDEPATFALDRPMLAANARDYVYLGPVEINRSGTRSYALWVAYCSTIARNDGREFAAPARAYLMIDGEPMELGSAEPHAPLADWLYRPPVVGGSKVMYALTRAQLAAIARAHELSIVIEGEDDAVAEFSPWRDGFAGLSGFAHYLEGPDMAAVPLNDD